MNKVVYIISTGDIITGKTAGSQRVMKIAGSLAASGIEVFLCSLPHIKGSTVEPVIIRPGVFMLASKRGPGRNSSGSGIFLKSISRHMQTIDSKPVIFLYPTTFVLKDFIYLLYFRIFKQISFFCEINELRTAIALTPAPAVNMPSRIRNRLKSYLEYFKYRLNELQIPLYDGIVVISTALETYFAGKARKIIRIPILCDADVIDDHVMPEWLPDSPFRICFAGYIKYEKEGFDLLYEAINLVKVNYDIDLYLYGMMEENDRIMLDRLATRYDLQENVHYMGNIEPELLTEEFRKYNLLILPRPLNKRTQYGFSTKLSEYLVSGIPVLVTDVSDNGLYIKDGFNGYIILPGSSSVMSDKLQAIINNYNNQAADLVKNAHLTVREKLDYRIYSGIYNDFLWPETEVSE